MSKVLVVAEHDGRNLSDATAKTLSCALRIPESVTDIGVLAAPGGVIAKQAAALAGVSQVLLAEDAAYEPALAAVLAPRIAELADGYSHIFGPSTTFGRDLMPRVAALLGTTQVSEIMAVETASRFKRPIYAGNAIATIEVTTRPVIGTVRVASFDSAGGGATVAPIAARPLHAALPAHTRFLGRESAAEGRVDLQSARRVVAGGRGVGSAENFRLLEALADALGAAVGASRAAVDSGFAPNELQVGQTGKIIAPELYIAVGISGAIQHLTGIKDAGTIVAINNDPEAPVHKVADISLVADLFNTLPELTDKLR